MDRRSFFTTPLNQKVVANQPPLSVQRTQSGLNPYAGTWTENEVLHLLKRTMFGAKKTDIDYFKTRTLNQAVDELLNPLSALPTPPVKEYDAVGALTQPDNNIVAGTTWVNDPNNDGLIISRRRASFKKWWVGLMANQDRSIREKMNLFWHNHFSTETNDVGNSQFIYKHHAMLRSNALGNFKTLVKLVSLDPAMLVYLNGQANTSTAPDENNGRELQELFCCGKGLESQYTEADVKAAARVLTGWRNDGNTFTSYFTASRHDITNKQFSAFYNNTIIQGRTGATAGDLEIDDMLNMIFATQEVAKYVCRRIYRWFVYYDIDANTEANIIAPLAAIFRNGNYEIKPVLSALLKSEHFFDSLNMACQIKSPVDLVIGMCREMDVQFQPPADYISNYGLWNYLVSWLNNMQQNIGDPPDVSGWKAYYQEPQFYEIWINSDTLPKRTQFTDTLTVTGYTFNSKKIMVDGVEFAKKLSNPADPNMLLSDSIKYLLRLNLSQTSRDQIKKDILLGGQVTDYYWTDAWNTFISTPTNTANANIVKTRLTNLYKYLMGLAEYQLA
ncbi:MAG: DUF1800 domain-containing protein [Chitinophagaceae bacterium]|nr:DUF1800 domain-containing protein [Chitinophagaceae bacterium]